MFRCVSPFEISICFHKLPLIEDISREKKFKLLRLAGGKKKTRQLTKDWAGQLIEFSCMIWFSEILFLRSTSGEHHCLGLAL